MKAVTAMTRNVVTIEPSQSLKDAHEIMIEWSIRHLPVVQNRKVVGILSDRDVLIHASRGKNGLAVPSLQVKEAMTAMPMTCQSSAAVGKIARMMIEHKIDSLPIVNPEGELVGLVTSSDLLELLAEREDMTDGRVITFQYTIHRAGSEYAATM